MNSLTTILRDNFEALRWDAEQKSTARDYFSQQWQNTLSASVTTKKAQLENDIRLKSSTMLELQTLQAYVASIRSQGDRLQDIVMKNPCLADMFKNNDDQMNFLLTQPPLTFLVSNFTLIKKKMIILKPRKKI